MKVIKARTKTLRNTLVSAGILLFLAVAGGVAYTYFAGPEGGKAATAPAATASDAGVIKPSKPADNAVESAAIQTLSTPVPPGSNAAISVKTNAGSACKISVVYGAKASTDSGLAPKTADEYGTVTWAWTVESSVPFGKYPVQVDCAFHGRSAMVRGDLEVTKESN